MKRLLLFLLLLSISFAEYGPSRITIERVWTITDAPGNFIDFQGALAVNNSNQKIVSVETDSQTDYVIDDHGTVWISYQGNMTGSELVLKGKAVVDIDYDTRIIEDSPIPDQSLQATNMTSANTAIKSQALLLAEQNSSLATIANLVNWVNSHVKYDESYWDKIKSAEEVFEEQRGVCVQSTHLLISMARSLGFETKYVNGYVFSDVWAPHAWAEIYVPSQGWISADPTYNQAGNLDNSHIALSYGEDQISVYDILLSRNNNSTLEVEDKIITDFIHEDPDDILSIKFNDKTYVVEVTITNNRSSYVFGTYNFKSGDSEESSVILLKPNETLHKYHGLNYSLFKQSNEIPVSASFNDARDELKINSNPPLCAFPFVLLVLAFRVVG
jgi:transglutaminase-like putative cysteine protease